MNLETEYKNCLKGIIHNLEYHLRRQAKLHSGREQSILSGDRRIARAVKRNTSLLIQDNKYLLRKNRRAIEHFFGIEEYQRISNLSHKNVQIEPTNEIRP
jgi:hypothetical protein